MHNLFKNYGFIGLVRLVTCWVMTKLFYRPARLIRKPFYVRGRNSITWGVGFTTGVGTRLDAFSNANNNDKIIVIGDRVQINDYVHIGAVESIHIGDDVLIASKVFISDHNHGQYDNYNKLSNPDVSPIDRPLVSSPVVIGDKVWLGEGVCILPGVTIGKGSIVGAGSVVTHNIPANSIAVGVPAKVVKLYDVQLEKWFVK